MSEKPRPYWMTKHGPEDIGLMELVAIGFVVGVTVLFPVILIGVAILTAILA